MPPVIKRALLRDVAEKYALRALVETGTFFGDTAVGLSKTFVKVHTIEAAPELYRAAEIRFKNHNNVVRHFGDSGKILPEIIKQLTSASLFWLDAHIQEFAVHGEENPILAEISHIVSDRRFNHVMAIDDVRLFGRKPEYPTLEQLKSCLSAAGRRYSLNFIGDLAIVSLE